MTCNVVCFLNVLLFISNFFICVVKLAHDTRLCVAHA